MSIRESNINKFINIIPSDYVEREELATTIENSIYEWTKKKAISEIIYDELENKQFKRIYINKIIQIYSNLKSESYIKNNYLMQSIIDKKINPTELPNFTPVQLFPEHWKNMLDKMEELNQIKYNVVEQAVTDEYLCKRCNNRKCTFYLRQTRSADEPMTTFVTCTVCNNRWNF